MHISIGSRDARKRIAGSRHHRSSVWRAATLFGTFRFLLCLDAVGAESSIPGDLRAGVYAKDIGGCGEQGTAAGRPQRLLPAHVGDATGAALRVEIAYPHVALLALPEPT